MTDPRSHRPFPHSPRPRHILDRRAFLGGLTAGALGAAFSGSAAAQSLFDNAKDLLKGTLGGDGGATGGLAESEIADGLREALRIGSDLVVEQLGATDGFNLDPVAHIPLPEDLRTAQGYLKKVGLGALGDEVELKMNRAAETAMEDSGEIVVSAIEAMTLEDARGILEGPDDAATQYLARVAGDDIRARIKPVVDSALSEVGAINAVDTMLSSYRSIPFVPDVKGDLSAHATDGAFSGLFHYIAVEEKAIRENPTKRTTDLLKRVFSRA
jgi:hypothetical protein